MEIGRVITLMIQVSALPFAFNIGFAVLMFMTQGVFADRSACLFVITSTGAVFLWVLKNVKASVIGYLKEDTLRLRQKDQWARIPMIINTAADELALAARSHILSTLLAGYILIAVVFALAYQAVEGTPAGSILTNVYFSLTTLATVGYGDISPRGFGRVLACIEMISGVAYQVLAIGGGAAYLLDLGKNQPSE
ncbi:MAG: two pore domain potassium channel family protein [Candidatus Omnitrophica bacterium]|nr:two pore domain potassium channel family protein [Candidatus Omnitrophota bacterium]